MMDLNPSFFIFKGAMCWWGGGTQTVPKYGGALIVGLAAGGAVQCCGGGREDNLSVTIRLSPRSLLSTALHTQDRSGESRWAFK